MAGYDTGRKEITSHSRLFPGNRNLSHQRWLMRGRKRPFQLFFQTMTWKTFTTRMNSDFFYQCLPNKSYQLKSEKCYGKKLSKIRITGMAAANAMCDKLDVFQWEGQESTMLQKCQVFTLSLQKPTKKLDGWEIVWRLAQRTGQEVCFWRKKCCFCDRQLSSTFSYWQPKSNKFVFPTT